MSNLFNYYCNDTIYSTISDNYIYRGDMSITACPSPANQQSCECSYAGDLYHMNPTILRDIPLKTTCIKQYVYVEMVYRFIQV